LNEGRARARPEEGIEVSGVSIRGLRKHFASQEIKASASIKGKGAINGLDLEIRNGEFFVLLGPSGCGKTTTLRCIAGLEQPDAGSIRIGDEWVAAPERGIVVAPNKRPVGMVFQSYALWPHMTVYDNVAYPLKQRRRGLSRSEADAQIKKALALVGLEGLGERGPAALSGGQQQRVALARAIVARPDLLLFDEPLSNLDAQLRVRLRSDLRRVHDQGGHTSIFVTHDQAEALAIADRIAVMREGCIEQLGAPEDIFLSPRSRFVAEFVGFDNILEGVVVASAASELRFKPDGWSSELIARPNTALTAGSRACVALRSSNLLISAQRGAGGNVFAATLHGISYLGEYFQGELTLSGSGLLGRFAGHPRELAEPSARASAQPVFVQIGPSDVVALPLDSATPDNVAAFAQSAQKNRSKPQLDTRENSTRSIL